MSNIMIKDFGIRDVKHGHEWFFYKNKSVIYINDSRFTVKKDSIKIKGAVTAKIYQEFIDILIKEQKDLIKKHQEDK